MAEDSVDSPVTPDVTKSSGVELRRHSSGKASSGNSEEKVLPRYLRASTGSCHDFCKYGRKHEFEENESHTIPKRGLRKPLRRSSEENVSGTKTSVAQLRASADSKPTKKTSAVKLRASSVDSKPEILETFGAKKDEVPTKSLESLRKPENEVQVNRKKSVKPSNHLKSNTSDLPKKMTWEISSTSRKVEASSKSTTFRAKEMKLSSKPKSITGKTMASKNSSEGSIGQRNSELKMEKRAASSKVAARKLIAPLRASLSPKPSLQIVASSDAKKLKGLKIVPPLKNQSKDRNDEPKQHRDVKVEEKTLYVIKVNGENKCLQSDENASHVSESPLLKPPSSPKFSSSLSSRSSSQEDQEEESEYTTSEIEEDSFSANDEIEHIENGEGLDVEQKGKPKKEGVVCSENKDCQTRKLKFVRGKWVEIKSDISSPRRLKFRRGKVLGENANGKDEAERKIYRRRDDGDGGDDDDDATTGPEKVVLRHQDVQGKKDEQGLFNNVIEETASKLAETRKSKVKALVGAFETVISLQEKRPSSATN